MLLAQITDLHMRPDDAPFAGEVTTRHLISAALEAVNAAGPDAVIITGDLADRGLPEEYALLREELRRLAAPIFVIPGNHDDREAMRSAFSDHAYLPEVGELSWVIEEFPLRLIGLDSLMPGQTGGRLGQDGLDWLEARLDEDDRPTVIAIHHPPFPCGIPAMNRIGLADGGALGSLIASRPHVVRVLAGHLHRGLLLKWAGTVGVVAPSVVHQVALDLNLEEMASWILEPPAILLHQLTDNGDLISHTAYVDGYGGPRPFDLEEIAAKI